MGFRPNVLEEFSVFKDVEERTALKGRRRGEAASRDANSRKIHSGLRFPLFFHFLSLFYMCVRSVCLGESRFHVRSTEKGGMRKNCGNALMFSALLCGPMLLCGFGSDLSLGPLELHSKQEPSLCSLPCVEEA